VRIPPAAEGKKFRAEELQGSSAVVAGKPIPTHGLDSWRIKMNPAFGRRVPPSDGSRIRGAPAEFFS
jgi:hypothetical protein